jgi:hypothetical protein
VKPNWSVISGHRWQVSVWPTLWRYPRFARAGGRLGEWPHDWRSKGYPGPIYSLWFVVGPIEVRRFWRQAAGRGPTPST